MFDDALVESRKSNALGGKRLSLPVALALHLAVIGAFVGASAWFPGEPPEPVERVTVPIMVALTPLRSVPAGGGEPHPPAHGAGPRVRHEMVQPDLQRIDPVATAVPPADATRIADDANTGIDDAGSVTEIDGNGNGGGGNGPGNGGGGGGGESEEILMPGGDVHAPELLERVVPDYPEAARRAHLQGTVILEAVITTAGEVREIRVLKPLHPLLDEAAVRAVRRWRYRSATLHERAVTVSLTVAVTFGLDGWTRLRERRSRTGRTLHSHDTSSRPSRADESRDGPGVSRLDPITLSSRARARDPVTGTARSTSFRFERGFLVAAFLGMTED